MNYLLIENKGELDISSLILLGASTKRNDSSKIGFFGSGNKYAIATLLRNGIDFKIFSGDTEISIQTEDVVFRDMSFKKIIIDGKDTSLTTDMGPQWEPWMAIREWVSNSMDEGSSNIINNTSTVSGREGYTRFYVSHSKDIKEMIDKWNLYFTFDREDTIDTSSLGKVFPQTELNNNLVLYRRGIRVYYTEGLKSLYQYDLNEYEISESRVIDNIYSAGAKTVRFINSLGNVSVYKTILEKAARQESWENTLAWDWAMSSVNPVWEDAIGDKVLIVDTLAGFYMDIQKSKPHYVVNYYLVKQLKKAFPNIKVYGLTDSGEQVAFKEIEVSPKQEFLLKECLKFLASTDYAVEYPVKIVKFEERENLGLAHNKTIYISDRAFDLGRKEIVATIIEENEHLVTGLKDCSRAFQNHLFNLFLTEKEYRFGQFL